MLKGGLQVLSTTPVSAEMTLKYSRITSVSPFFTLDLHNFKLDMESATHTIFLFQENTPSRPFKKRSLTDTSALRSLLWMDFFIGTPGTIILIKMYLFRGDLDRPMRLVAGYPDLNVVCCQNSIALVPQNPSRPLSGLRPHKWKFFEKIDLKVVRRT